MFAVSPQIIKLYDINSLKNSVSVKISVYLRVRVCMLVCVCVLVCTVDTYAETWLIKFLKNENCSIWRRGGSSASPENP